MEPQLNRVDFLPSLEKDQTSAERLFAAQTEPFDTFWEAPDDIEKGYDSFGRFYKRNYGRFLPADTSARILVTSCGPGYFVNFLLQRGFRNVRGIDADPEKIAWAAKRNLPCRTAGIYDYLAPGRQPFDLIVAEQEINHLTKSEILDFLRLCHRNLRPRGLLIVHSLNGANPITGAEALAQNMDHFNTFTEYSLKQVLAHAGFAEIQVFPLNLYIFYENPLNYVGMAGNALLNTLFRAAFIFYGKKNRIFSKKIGALARKT